MREILFRGKEKHHHKWVEGWYCPSVFGMFPPDPAIVPKEDANNGYWHPEMIVGETLGQYTGLTDKNGKKIFEGDICQIKGISYLDETPFVVEWNEEFSGWYWKNLDFASATDTITAEIAETSKVIGNIHDNPELLQGGE